MGAGLALDSQLCGARDDNHSGAHKPLDARRRPFIYHGGMESELHRNVVLLGAGHAHLYVAQHAREFHREGVRVTLVDPGYFWYSGMGTGMLGGMYGADEDRIDPEWLVKSNGGFFVQDHAVGLDRRNREVRLGSGRTVPYDVVSLNVGSEINWNGNLPNQPNVWTVKPIEQLWRLRQELEQRLSDHSVCPRIVVIGGGPTGCEIAANLCALVERVGASAHVAIMSRSSRIAQRYRPAVSRTLATLLTRRGVTLALGSPVERVEASHVVSENGERHPFEMAVLATGLRPSRTVDQLGLATGDLGGLRVNDRLQSVDDDRVFGAGDCITLEGHDLPKLGVFAVRQSPLLLHNLIARVTNKPLKAYHPQKRFLAILNLGNGQGLATWGPIYWQGQLSLWLKDRIDRRFVNQYR